MGYLAQPYGCAKSFKFFMEEIMGKKISNFLHDFSVLICVVAILVMIVLMIVVVIGRYFFGKVPAWSEEFALIGMSWLGLMSAAIIEHDKDHIRISILDQVYPKNLLNLFGILRYILKLCFSGAMIYYSFRIIMTNKGFLASLPISSSINYWPGLLASIFIALFYYFE